MDRISHLPEEIQSKILSYLETKDVMRTMFLSKRWKSLWMLVPRLDFDDSTHFTQPISSESDYWKFRRFVDRSLMSREGQVLPSLYLKLQQKCTDGDIATWVGTAVKRGLMELKLEYSSYWIITMAKSLYTCETLVVLKLRGVRLDVPDLVCLRPVHTTKSYRDRRQIFKILVPSLKRFTLFDFSEDSGITELVIDAPCLKYLLIGDRSGSLSFGENINIPEVVEVDVFVILGRPEKLLHSLSSVKHIRLCLSASEVMYPVGTCFHRLKHLEVCTCKSEWLDLFMRLLEDSPSLKVIKINQYHPVTNPRPHWNQPGSVPSCLSSNLETLEWVRYEGTQEEKELSTYILKTAVCLKKARFTARSTDPNKKLQMLQELSLSPRISSTCELVFN